MSASNGTIPANAVVGGIVESGEKLYIGRAPYKCSVTPGKIQPSQGGLFISYGGQVVKFTDYEQLVYVDKVEQCKWNTLAETEWPYRDNFLQVLRTWLTQIAECVTKSAVILLSPVPKRAIKNVSASMVLFVIPANQKQETVF